MTDRHIEQKLLDQERALVEQRKQTNSALQQLYTAMNELEQQVSAALDSLKQEIARNAKAARRTGYLTLATLFLQVLVIVFLIGRITSPSVVQTIRVWWFSPTPCPALEVHL